MAKKKQPKITWSYTTSSDTQTIIIKLSDLKKNKNTGWTGSLTESTTSSTWTNL